MTKITTKLTVNKEMRNGLDSLVESPQWSNEKIISHHFTKGFLSDSRRIVNQLTSAELVQALFVGYETIKTGKELVSKVAFTDNNVTGLVTMYNNVKNARTMTYNDGIKDGITMALSQTGTKVEGINAPTEPLMADF